MNSQDTSMDMIVFTIGNEEYCIPVASVREIRSWSQTTSMPHAPAYMLGVVNLRGSVLPIVDLSARFGYPPAEPSPRHAIVIVETGSELTGLLVDGVSEILTVTENQVQPAPTMGADVVDEFIEGIITLNERIISLVSLRCVMPVVALMAA